MKLLSTMITTEKEITKEITVCVDDQTAMVLEQCTEEFRQMYILDVCILILWSDDNTITNHHAIVATTIYSNLRR